MILVDLALALVVFAGCALLGLTGVLLIKEIRRKDEDKQ